MHLWTRATFGVGVAAAVGLAVAGDEALPMKDLKIPLDRYDDGRPKVQLVAAGASADGGKEMRAVQVRIEFYGEKDIDTVVSLDECLYNRETGLAKSASEVNIEKAGIQITGKGMECNTKDQTVKLLAKVTVTLDRSKLKKAKTNAP